MDKNKMTKEEYEEYLDEIDLDEDEYEDDEIGRGNSEKEEKAEDNNQDTFETAKEFYRYDNGNRFLNPSKIFGALIGMVAVVAHVVHTFVSNILFDKYEQLSIREAFMRGLGKFGTPGEISSSNKEKEELDDKENKHEKELVLKRADIPNRAVQRVNPMSDNIEQDLKVLKEALKNPSIQHIFAMNGYLADIINNKDEAYLFEYANNEVQEKAYGFCASDLLSGNASNMLHAIQTFEKSSSIEAALKSAAIISAMAIKAAENDKMDIREVIKDNLIGFTDYKTSCGSSTVEYLLNTEKTDMIDIALDGNVIYSISAQQLCNEPFSEYQDKILKSINLQAEKTAILGEELKIVWHNEKNEAILYDQNEMQLGTFSFQTTKDVQNLINILKEEEIYPLYKKGEEYIPLKPEAVAFTVGMLTNPDMQIERSEDGLAINPFTGISEPDGKSHLYIEHDECGIKLHTFLPSQEEKNDSFLICDFTSRNVLSDKSICEISSCVQDAISVIEKIQDMDLTYKRTSEQEMEVLTLLKDELTSDVMDELYNKAKKDTLCKNTFTSDLTPMQEIMEQTHSSFVTNENKKEDNAIFDDVDCNTIKESEENAIENTSMFVPAFDEEER